MAKHSKKYSEAISEIEDIIAKIENRDLDVDELAENVKKVSALIKICKDKLHQTEEEIQKILDSIKD